MSQAFYRKWRPRKWEAVVGQEHVIQTLRNAVAGERIAHAYLFAGPRGTGKTTTARILAKAANCLDPDLAVRPCDKCEHCQAVNAGRFLDLIEIDAASNTSVDDVRELRDKINFSPNQGRYKVYVVDEVHMLSTAAFNALLKTLEEPPAHAIFILATTEAHKIPATVLSRCQRHEFRRIPVTEIMTYLNDLAAGENLQVTPEALGLIARQATGSLRDAISLLDQLASTGQEISLELAQSVLGTAASQAVMAVVAALIAHDPAAGLDQIHAALDSGSDPRQFARQMVDYLRDLLLIRMGNADQVDATKEVRAQMAQHAQTFTTPELLRVIRAFNYAANDARATWQPALPLEIAFVESCEAPPEAAPETPLSYSPPTPVKSQPQSVKPVSTPQAPPPPKETKGTLTSEEGHAIQALKENWPQVLSLVRQQNPNTYGLLNSCQSRYLDGKVLTLGFASDLLKNQMAKKENLALVQQALVEVLGIEIVIRCVINTAKRTTIPTEVDDNGMVAAALRDLGGEIVDIQ
ncbi:MAG TPA: DNA polymerase III subunit gamma/tau [Anaerolineales bacterium]|nr:DNA polymerase III subunit gamma/tau [Anaerolineales bacterium]